MCDGKVAIVVGAGSGIGRAIAKQFAQNGARVAVAGIREQLVAQTALLRRRAS